MRVGIKAKVSRAILLASSGAAIVLTAPVQAQEAPVGASADTAEEGNIIVVTATRREESVIDVPASVSVLDTETLTQTGARDLGDYLFAQPGVNYNKTGAPGRGAITIRGISTGNLTTPVVGVYVDDVPIGSALNFTDGDDAFDQGLLDLQRIEILRGPQGTLFGVSALSGALRYITNEPELNEFSGEGTVTGSFTEGGGFGTTVNANINLPINDTVAVRVAGFYTHDGGYVDAIGPNGGEDVNDGDIYGLRGSILFAPTDRIEIRASAQIQKTKYNGLSFVDVDPGTLEPTVADLTAGNLLFDETQDLETQLYSLAVKYDLGFADLVSVTAYQEKSIDRRQDFSDTGIFFGGLFEPFFPPVIATVDNRFSKVEKWTQEVRLVSNSDGPIQWQGGVFYTTEDGVLQQNLIQTYEGGIVADGTNFPLFFGPDAGFIADYEEIAGFLTVDWYVTDALVLSGGVRVAHNKIDVQQINTGFFAGAPNNGSSTSETPVTFLATARYEVAPEKNFYVRVASGYRAGGPNVGLVDPSSPTGVTQSPPTYGSDSLINYELGYKGVHADGVMTLEAAIYQIDWSDIQQAVSSGNFTAFTDNAGEARIRGAELGVVIRPDRSFEFGGAFSLIDAEITEVAQGAIIPAAEGDKLPGSADFQANVYAQFNADFGTGKAYLRGELVYLDDRLTGFSADPNAVELPGFEQINLATGIEFDSFDIGVFARNIADTRGLLGVLPPDVPGLFPANATFVRPRTIGAFVTARF